MREICFGTLCWIFEQFINCIKPTTHRSCSIFTLLLQQHPAMQQQETLSSSGWISYDVVPLSPSAVLQFAHSSGLSMWFPLNFCLCSSHAGRMRSGSGTPTPTTLCCLTRAPPFLSCTRCSSLHLWSKQGVHRWEDDFYKQNTWETAQKSELGISPFWMAVTVKQAAAQFPKLCDLNL